MKQIVWLLPLVALGCGENLSTAPSLNPTPSDVVVANAFQPLVDACVDGAAAAHRETARRYCACVYREAARRWTLEYFSKNVARCEAELDADVSELCAKEAKQ